MKEATDVINEVIVHSGLNAPSLAKAIGVIPKRIYDILQGNTKKISVDVANRICEAFPEINKAYLLKGEGALLKADGTTISVNHSPYANVAGNDIIMTPEQKATRIIETDDTISKADLFAVIRHLQMMNDKHLATIEKLQTANDKLNALLLELVGKWKDVDSADVSKVMQDFDKMS